jgi:hypothetical protein
MRWRNQLAICFYIVGTQLEFGMQFIDGLGFVSCFRPLCRSYAMLVGCVSNKKKKEKAVDCVAGSDLVGVES